MEVPTIASGSCEVVSLYDYKMSQVIEGDGHPFYALVMAAMRQADTFNLEKLGALFPETLAELRERYNAPGGVIASDPEAKLAYSPNNTTKEG